MFVLFLISRLLTFPAVWTCLSLMLSANFSFHFPICSCAVDLFQAYVTHPASSKKMELIQTILNLFIQANIWTCKTAAKCYDVSQGRRAHRLQVSPWCVLSGTINWQRATWKLDSHTATCRQSEALYVLEVLFLSTRFSLHSLTASSDAPSERGFEVR